MRQRLKSDHEYIDGFRTDKHGAPVGRMWTDEQRAERGGRPTLEIDALSGPIAQVVNTLSESRPAAQVLPIGGGADPERAEVWQGMLRRIQTTPEAEYAAAYAVDHLGKIGRCAWLIKAEFPEYNGHPEDPANWELELVRCWIENQHQVYLDPAATRPDRTDARFGFILQEFSKAEFDSRFGQGAFEENRSAFEALAVETRARVTSWLVKDRITVASWYRIKEETVVLRGTDGTGQPRTREVKERRCCHSLITATHEYDFEILPIPYVPIIQGDAKRVNVDGEKDVRGIVRRGRQPQNMLNVATSYIAETIGRAARQEVIAPIGSFEKLEAFWDMTKRYPYRYYNPVDVHGRLAPPPEIVSIEPPIQALTLWLQQNEAAVRKATLYFDVDSDETASDRSKMSGRALIQRQRQGELGNSDFMRAYVFMIQAETKILMAWIPHVYDAARGMRITGRDEKEFTAVTYFGEAFAPDAQRLAQGIGQQPDVPEGVRGIYDLSVGRYDIKIAVQRNPGTQRQETVDFLTQLLPNLPPEMQAKGFPILIESLDGPGMSKLHAALSPKQDSVPIEEAQKAQMVIDEQSRIINELKDQIDRKADELQSRERIEAAKIEAEIQKAKIDAEVKMMLAELDLKKQAAMAEFDARQAELSHVRGEASADHAAAREFALREPESGNGATA